LWKVEPVFPPPFFKLLPDLLFPAQWFDMDSEAAKLCSLSSVSTLNAAATRDSGVDFVLVWDDKSQVRHDPKLDLCMFSVNY
jgi:hypothetical protein